MLGTAGSILLNLEECRSIHTCREFNLESIFLLFTESDEAAFIGEHKELVHPLACSSVLISYCIGVAALHHKGNFRCLNLGAVPFAAIAAVIEEFLAVGINHCLPEVGSAVYIKYEGRINLGAGLRFGFRFGFGNHFVGGVGAVIIGVILKGDACDGNLRAFCGPAKVKYHLYGSGVNTGNILHIEDVFTFLHIFLLNKEEVVVTCCVGELEGNTAAKLVDGHYAGEIIVLIGREGDICSGNKVELCLPLTVASVVNGKGIRIDGERKSNLSAPTRAVPGVTLIHTCIFTNFPDIVLGVVVESVPTLLSLNCKLSLGVICRLAGSVAHIHTYLESTSIEEGLLETVTGTCKHKLSGLVGLPDRNETGYAIGKGEGNDVAINGHYGVNSGR